MKANNAATIAEIKINDDIAVSIDKGMSLLQYIRKVVAEAHVYSAKAVKLSCIVNGVTKSYELKEKFNEAKEGLVATERISKITGKVVEDNEVANTVIKLQSFAAKYIADITKDADVSGLYFASNKEFNKKLQKSTFAEIFLHFSGALKAVRSTVMAAKKTEQLFFAEHGYKQIIDSNRATVKTINSTLKALANSTK